MTLSLQEISDRLEIQDLLAHYCYAVDDRDWDAYRNVFTPDAILDDSVTGGIRGGVEEHVPYMQKALSKILISQHGISTILFDIKGDQARVRVLDFGPNGGRSRRRQDAGLFSGALVSQQPRANAPGMAN